MLFSLNGNDSPTSFRAPVAFPVKTTVYPGGARKKERTASRASLACDDESFELPAILQYVVRAYNLIAYLLLTE